MALSLDFRCSLERLLRIEWPHHLKCSVDRLGALYCARSSASEPKVCGISLGRLYLLCGRTPPRHEHGSSCRGLSRFQLWCCSGIVKRGPKSEVELLITYSHCFCHLALADHRAKELFAGWGQADEASAQRM